MLLKIRGAFLFRDIMFFDIALSLRADNLIKLKTLFLR